MVTVRFTNTSFELLEDLAKNNERDWYHVHKQDFETKLLNPFAVTLSAVSERLVAAGLNFRGGKKTMFRMNRDVRFSRDKSPYKTNVSGLLTPGGDKYQGQGFVYLHLDAQGGFAAFGRYKLDARALGPIRDRIIEQPDRFGRILNGLKAEGIDLVRTGALKSVPRGYAEYADHRFVDELRLTHMMVQLDLPTTAWKSGDVVGRVTTHAVICRDFLEFVSV